MDERIKKFPVIFLSLGLANNLISRSKMNDASVEIVFEKEIYKMV